MAIVYANRSPLSRREQRRVEKQERLIERLDRQARVRRAHPGNCILRRAKVNQIEEKSVIEDVLPVKAGRTS